MPALAKVPQGVRGHHFTHLPATLMVWHCSAQLLWPSRAAPTMTDFQEANLLPGADVPFISP